MALSTFKDHVSRVLDQYEELEKIIEEQDFRGPQSPDQMLKLLELIYLSRQNDIQGEIGYQLIALNRIAKHK